jgi:hypothetical protein
LNFEATKSDRNFQKNRFLWWTMVFCLINLGHQTISKILGDAEKFRLVINESKFTSEKNQKMSTHQKQSQVEATYDRANAFH